MDTISIWLIGLAALGISLQSDTLLASTSAIVKQSLLHSLAWVKSHTPSGLGSSMLTLFIYAVLVILGITAADTQVVQTFFQLLSDHPTLVFGINATVMLVAAGYGVGSGSPMPALTSIAFVSVLQFQLMGYLYLISGCTAFALFAIAVDSIVNPSVENKQAKTMAALKKQAKQGRWYYRSKSAPDITLRSAEGVKMRIILQIATIAPVLLALYVLKAVSSIIEPYLLAYMSSIEVTLIFAIFAFCFTTMLSLAAKSSYDSLRPLFRLPPRAV